MRNWTPQTIVIRALMGMLVSMSTHSCLFGCSCQDEVVGESQTEQDAASDDPLADDSLPKLNLYIAMQQELRAIDEQINRTQRAVPLSDAQRRREMMAAVEQMKARKQQIREALPSAAIEAFIESPDSNQVVTSHVVALVRDLLAETINPQRFDPEQAYQVATRLCATQTTNQALYFFAGRAAFVTERFDEAESYFRRLAELGATVPDETWKTLALLRERYTRELEMRAQDEVASLPRVRLKTTAGEVVIELFEDQAPNTVARFLELVEKKFYDGMIFYQHRPGQYSATGCFRGDGTTTYEYYLPDESQREDARHLFVGSIEMLAPEPNRASCQFAIVHQPIDSHTKKGTVFGRVISGMDVVFKFAPIEPQMRFARPSTRINSATVERKRTHVYEVKEKIPFNEQPRLQLPGVDKGGGGPGS